MAIDTAAVNPFNGYGKILASLPVRWITVTPHDTNYLEGDVGEHNCAIALKSVDGGVIYYEDVWDAGTQKSIELVAGEVISGLFTRVRTSTTSTKVYAGFMEGPLS